MKTRKEKKFKFVKYILYIILGICLSYNIIFLLNTTITGNDYITLFGITFFNMENNLMKDDIFQNDLVMVIKENELQEGAIIAYKVNGATRINKIINEQQGYVTKSNQNYYPDIEKISLEQIIGKKVVNIPFVGIILKILQSQITSFLILILLIIYYIQNKYMYKKRKERIRKKKRLKEDING